MSHVKYPEVEVQLSGEDGNSYAILGRVRSAMKRAGVPRHEIEEFSTEAMSGDYDHMLQTVMQTVETR